MYLYSFVAKSYLACTKYSPECIRQFPKYRHIWRVPQDFHKTPSPLKRRSTTFHYRTSFFFCCLLIFSSQNPPNSIQKINKFSIGLKSLVTQHFSVSKIFLFFLKILLVSTSQITICKIHHKQNFSLLAPTWNKEVIKFRLRSSNDYKFHGLITLTHPHTPLPNQILNFHQVPEELTRISGVTQKTFRTTAASSLPW